MKNILNVVKTIYGFFIFPIFVLILHVFLIFFTKVYLIFPWFDIPIHFLGGFAIGYSYFLILNYLHEKNYLKTNSLIKVVFIISLVSLTAVFWEFFEYFAGYLTGFGLQGNLDDTMLDLIIGIFGGLVAAVFFEMVNYKYSKI